MCLLFDDLNVRVYDNIKEEVNGESSPIYIYLGVCEKREQRDASRLIGRKPHP